MVLKVVNTNNSIWHSRKEASLGIKERNTQRKLGQKLVHLCTSNMQKEQEMERKLQKKPTKHLEKKDTTKEIIPIYVGKTHTFGKAEEISQTGDMLESENLVGMYSNTDTYGKKKMAKSQRATKYITLTTTNKTTESRILNACLTQTTRNLTHSHLIQKPRDLFLDRKVIE